EDSAFGIVLSVFFGVGIVLLTWVQRAPGGNQTGLDRFLFGQAATLMVSDLWLTALFGVPALLLVVLLFKEFKLLAFDRGFAASLGRPVRGLEVLLTALLVLVVVLGLQTVGVILMVATLVAPAAAARQWTDDLALMVPLAGLIGAASGALGALASHIVPQLPTGPAIVLVASAAFVVSFLAAPRRGLVGELLRRRAVSLRIRRENLLKDLYSEGEAAGGARAAVPLPRLLARRDVPRRCLRRALRSLTRAGFVTWTPQGLLLSPAGARAAADIVRKHRLWETYLSRFLELDGDHVHRDAEDMEHVLGDAEVAALEERLGHPAVDPHGEPIPPRGTP
ncbi:MAG: metal ABC transporter permease, partial [Candidatus Krumholzibacteriota bacterium]|nr:metal ABC transporter permease [Candidatus Krumholzibacteriota bacterium]